jgi:aspartyl-tRNA(Asn)/glutamyl-tRNA(Gln) amidotransferase subunit C
MTIEDLKETAALAHLNAGDEELVAAFPAFEQMLGYFAAMQEADAGSLSGQTGQNAGSSLVSSGYFRADVPPAGAGGDAASNLLNNAGERDGRFLVIPNVL